MTKSARPAEPIQVLVVGAGPVGLFAGLQATRAGLDVLLLDHVWRSQERGHATLLHGCTLSLLEESGVGSRLRAEGRRVDRIGLYVDGARVSTLELPSPALTVPQTTLEKVLIDALRREGVEIRAPHQATTIEQSPGHVDVHVMRRELVTTGSPANYSEWQPVESYAMRADFLIGADGYDSRVRSTLGIETVDMGPAESFAMFESSSPAEADSESALCFGDGLGSVMLPMSEGRVRWAFQLADHLDDKPDLVRLHALLSGRAPWYSDRPERVDWGTVTHFERRLARRFGKGRAWLAGDAAHVTSPFGSQSLNVGLSEAHELVQCIAQSASSKKSAELENYGAESTREWHKLLGVNVSFDLLPHAPPWLAAHARRLVPALPASGAELAKLLERLGLRLS